MAQGLPVIDMSALFDAEDEAAHARTASEIAAACQAHGFFYLIGHGVDAELLAALEEQSRLFFALPLAKKMQIAMPHGGRAWRGYFPAGGELTSGRPDLKEGLYLGAELSADHPRVRAGLALHGANLWPRSTPGLQPVVMAYMDRVTRAARALMGGVSLSLGLPQDYFEAHYTREPTILFRIFNYPTEGPAGTDWSRSWGVGEHTDYGLLTLLAQDRHGGLQVKTAEGWVEAPPLDGALVCNIGDMLERLTRGRFRSTPHRVLNRSGAQRLSFPLFYDPDFLAQMTPLPEVQRSEPSASVADRWDGANLDDVTGTYGDYLLAKVAKVFPDLMAATGPTPRR